MKQTAMTEQAELHAKVAQELVSTAIADASPGQRPIVRATCAMVHAVLALACQVADGADQKPYGWEPVATCALCGKVKGACAGHMTPTARKEWAGRQECRGCGQEIGPDETHVCCNWGGDR